MLSGLENYPVYTDPIFLFYVYRFVGVGYKTRKGTKKGENKVLTEEDKKRIVEYIRN